MAIRWPWYTDPVVLEEIQQLNTKLDQILAKLTTISAQEKKIMATLDEKLDAIEASQAAALLRIDEDVKSFEDEIAELKALVAAGQALTPAQEARLAAVQATLDGIDPRKPAVLPE